MDFLNLNQMAEIYLASPQGYDIMLDMNVQRGQRKTWAAFLVMGIPGAGAVGGVLSKFFNF